MYKPQAGAPAKRILVVEDEVISATTLKFFLQDFGYEVPAIVDTGEEAILKAVELRPDLILMDITLAGPMNGIEAADEIRKAYAVPIIYMTAHADPETLEKAKATEPFGFIPKPYDLNTLRTTIEAVFHKG